MRNMNQQGEGVPPFALICCLLPMMKQLSKCRAAGIRA
jgi:hypothetical protein